MRRHPLAAATFVALALGLAACEKAAPPAAEAPAAAPAPATPAIGIDLAGIDKTVKPGDDFEAYANGAWAAKAEIPADRSSIGSFLVAFEKAEQRQKELVQGLAAGKPAAGSDEARIADFYNAFMDEAGIEAKGLAPLQPELDAIGAIADKTALATKLGADLRADVDPLNATACSACSSRRAWTILRRTSATCCRAAWACRTATTTCPRTRRWPNCATSTGPTSPRC